MNHWIQIKAVLAKIPADWSVYADAFERYGCPSSEQTDRPPTISGYFEEIPAAEPLIAELSEELIQLGAKEVVRERVEEQDWSELWKIHFKPRLIGQILIRPTWEPLEVSPGQIELVLDPGQAFGTGDHPTTRLCLSLMQQMPIWGQRVLDLGCGSGVLGIAAVKLGAESVLASDIEAMSVEITKENAALNGVELETFCGDGFPPGGPWPVVISNIISATLIRLAPMAFELTQPGGVWLTSGIIRGNWPDVEAAAHRCGFTTETVEMEDDWVGAIFRR